MSVGTLVTVMCLRFICEEYSQIIVYRVIGVENTYVSGEIVHLSTCFLWVRSTHIKWQRSGHPSPLLTLMLILAQAKAYLLLSVQSGLYSTNTNSTGMCSISSARRTSFKTNLSGWIEVRISMYKGIGSSYQT